MKIAFSASQKPDAQAARDTLVARFGNVSPEDADVLAPVGGDGFMLETLKTHMDLGKPVYGINRGTIGFLMNGLAPDKLLDRIDAAERAVIHPLEMRCTSINDQQDTAMAINEVSLFREIHQTAHLSIYVNGKLRMEELICDGIMLATPAGSTAYNLSAHGPILPVGSQLLALTPISAFRPRRWRGALLPHDATVKIEAHQPEFRPVSAVADNYEVRRVRMVEIYERQDKEMTLLYDPEHSLEERIIREQFAY
ncbi:MAG: NAD kinase [Aquisalinus sp.]|nr:NAD kinase [Aquisalinus sp.]